MIVEHLEIKVTYKVGLGNVEMSDEVYEQLVKAADNFKGLDPTMLQDGYREAADWLSQNIRERDCKDWQAEVDDITYPED